MRQKCSIVFWRWCWKQQLANRAWLAIRAGDFFDVKACANCESSLGERINIERIRSCGEIISSLQARLVEKKDLEWAMVPRTGYPENTRNWAGLHWLSGNA